MFAVAAFQYLGEVDGIPDDVLADPRKWIRAVHRPDFEVRELVGFLTYGGTFLIQDRASVQTVHSENTDKACKYNTILSRATGKPNYAKSGDTTATSGSKLARRHTDILREWFLVCWPVP